jgi:hypothetical protein
MKKPGTKHSFVEVEGHPKGGSSSVVVVLFGHDHHGGFLGRSPQSAFHHSFKESILQPAETSHRFVQRLACRAVQGTRAVTLPELKSRLKQILFPFNSRQKSCHSPHLSSCSWLCAGSSSCTTSGFSLRQYLTRAGTANTARNARDARTARTSVNLTPFFFAFIALFSFSGFLHHFAWNPRLELVHWTFSHLRKPRIPHQSGLSFSVGTSPHRSVQDHRLAFWS